MKLTRRYLRKLILQEMKHQSRPFFGRAQPAYRSTMKPFTLGSQPLVPPAMDFLRGRNMELVKTNTGFGIVELSTNKPIMLDGPDKLQFTDFFVDEVGLGKEDGTVDAEKIIDLLGKAARSKGGRFEVSNALKEELGASSAEVLIIDYRSPPSGIGTLEKSGIVVQHDGASPPLRDGMRTSHYNSEMETREDYYEFAEWIKLNHGVAHVRDNELAYDVPPASGDLFTIDEWTEIIARSWPSREEMTEF